MWNWNYTNVNNDFFKKWSSELAYVVGLFITDGSISNYEKSGKKKVSFSNQTSDKDMLEKVASICGYKNEVIDFKCGMSRVQFAGDFIWRFFTDLGFDNHKTYNAKIPKQLIDKPELYSHLIRGMLDGDGSLVVRSRRKFVYPDVNIVGTQEIVDFVADVYPFFNTYKPHRMIYRVTYSGANAVKFLNKIYKDSTIYMDRKYNEYLKIKNWKTTCKRWTKEEKDFITNNYSTMYARDMEKILDRNFSSIVCCARRLGLKRTHSNGKI